MGRAPCCDKSTVKRGPWSPEEDNTLKNYLEKNGTGGNWISLPLRAGLKRCGKSCRLRWLNYLRPNIKRGAFTDEEDNIIISMYYQMGSRWSVIAANIPGRTDNDVKNYWNTKLKKKLNINDKLNPAIIPKINNHVTSTPTPSSSSFENQNHHLTTNQVDNHQFNVPNHSFSDLLSYSTSNTSMSQLPNFTSLANVDHNTHDLVGIPNSTWYPFNQTLLMSQTISALNNIDNVNVFPHEDISSAPGSSPVVYGSSVEDDPYLAELGFRLA